MIASEIVMLGGCTPKEICLHRANVVPPHRYECVVGKNIYDRFFYVVKGEINIHNKKGTSITAPSGTIIYLPSDVEYLSNWSEKEEGEYITFQFVLKDDNNNHLSLSEASVIAAKDKNGDFYSLFSIAHNEYIKHGEFVNIRLKQLFFEIFYKILKQQSRKQYEKKGDAFLIHKALRYINDNLMSDFCVDELASICNMSLSTFRRLFKKQTGTSPIKYKNHLKLLHAREMLKSGLYNVTEVSNILNCCDTAYFNRVYRKEFGVNPSDEVKTN